MSLLSDIAQLEASAFDTPWTEGDILAFCEAGDFLLLLIGSPPGGNEEPGALPILKVRAPGELNAAVPETMGRTPSRASLFRPAAFLLARIQEPDKTAEIIRIATKREARQRGLARRLLAAFENAFEGRILLEVSERNQPAVGLYKGAGFQIIHRRPDYYSDGSTAWIMEKHCPGTGSRED